MAIVHELSWSASRASTFATCRRRYFWDYYGSWRGWERGADAERRKAYVLKKMTRMPMWAGDCLHVAIAEWFERRRTGEAPGLEPTLDRALARFRNGYRESRDGTWKQRPARMTHLAEHHFAEPDVDESTGAAAAYGKRFVERITAGLERFFGDPALEPVRASEPDAWLACEEMGTFDLFETKVYAVPDFAFRDAAGAAWIYDWKTGKPREEDAFQLLLYAIYAEHRWGITPTSVTCVDAYLPTGELAELCFDATDLEAARSRIRDSIAQMRELHFDADREEGEREAFPMIPAGAPEARECGRCNYRGLCDR